MVLLKSFCLFSLFLSISVSAKIDQSPEFKMKKIQLKAKTLNVALADNERKRQYGLMNRSEWGSWQGMLFVFKEEAPRVFWMKNTQLALSIGFFNKDKVLQEIYQMKPTRSIFQKKVDKAVSQRPAQYALEVPMGWFEKNKLRPGVSFRLLD